MRRTIPITVTALALTIAIVLIERTSYGSTNESKPLPLVPKMVAELYLPEEQQASRALYNLYKALPLIELARLHSGARVSMDSPNLSLQLRDTIAAWFNSARWGCQPPAERMTAEAMEQAPAALVCKNQVIDFALQSPQKHIWKTLTLACAPERVAWVRNGLPLLPAWAMVPWKGGTSPTEPPAKPGYVSAWEELRALYPTYAELPEAQLRRLHQEHELRLDFRELAPNQQRVLLRGWDTYIRNCNSAFGNPESFGRTVSLRGRGFGIRQVRFTYAQSIAGGGWQPATPASVLPIRGPYRALFITFDPLFPKSPTEPNTLVRQNAGFLIAMPADLQRIVLAFTRRREDWFSKWKNPDGTNRPGAPLWPKDPWGGMRAVQSGR